METAKTTFEIRSWNEQPVDEEGGAKLTRASVVKSYAGELAGEGVVEQLATYDAEGGAEFVAYERFRGKLGSRAGTFVLRHEGTFRDGAVDSTWTVVPNSGTGELAGLAGTVAFTGEHAPSYDVALHYSLA